MLEKILKLANGSLVRAHGNVVVIEDTLACSGLSLLKTMVVNLLQNCDQVHMFLFERQAVHITKGLSQDLQGKLHLYDLTADPFGWKGSELTYDLDLVQHLKERVHPGKGKVCVLFDSLSALILHRSSVYTCQVVSRLSHLERHKPGIEVHCVLGVVHTDLHPPGIHIELEYTCDVIMSVSKSKDVHYSGRVVTLAKKPGGKIAKSDELYKLSPDFKLLHCRYITDVKNTTQLSIEEPVEEPDPTENLSFNLRLTEGERSARSIVRLPYVLDKRRKAAELAGFIKPDIYDGRGEAKIEYEADDVDDFDEEDPDDDLNI